MIMQMITFFAVLFGVAGFTVYDVCKDLDDGTNEAGRVNEGAGTREGE